MNYERVYNQIIERANLEERSKGGDIYYEKHHILPKCLGGDNDENNLVLLTAREHFICHKILVEIYPGDSSLKCASFLMAMKTYENRNYTVSSREYERIRLDYINSKDWYNISDLTKLKISNTLKDIYSIPENHPQFGKPKSAETRLKISNTLTGNIISDETREKIRVSVSKTWNSPEYADKREIQRQRAIEMYKNGTISRLGKPSKKKGKPFDGDKDKISKSLIDFYKTHKSKSINNFKVIQLDHDSNEIKIWESHHEAADHLGGMAKRILEVCNGKHNTHKNFKWKFYEN